MNPFGGLDYFLLLLLVLLPVVICGLKGKQLRVCGMLVCAVMLLAIFRTPHALLLLAAFWVWQTALTFGYLYLRKRAKKAWVFHLAVALSLLPLLLVPLYLINRRISLREKAVYIVLLLFLLFKCFFHKTEHWNLPHTRRSLRCIYIEITATFTPLSSVVIIYKSMININHSTFHINITPSQSSYFPHTKSSSYHYCKDRIPVFIYRVGFQEIQK